MIFIILLSFIGFCGLYFIINLKNKNASISLGLKTLPIVKGIPIFGVLLEIKGPLHVYLKNLGRKYGDIFSIKFGMRSVVVLNTFHFIKKTLKDDGENFSGRWQTKLKTIISENQGILFIDGDHWYTQRTFILKVLRDFGFGKSRSYEIVEKECKFMLDELKSHQKTDVDFSDLIPIYTANIISKFIMNKRFERTDPKIKLIEFAIFQTTKQSNVVQTLHLMFPKFDDSLIVSKITLWLASRMKLFSDIEKVFEEELKEHLKHLDFNSEGEDLMDRFLIEQQRLTQLSGSPQGFTDKQLIFTAFELFGAGYETTSTTLGWSMVFMARHSHIQKKVYEEIRESIGLEKLPTMNDKKSLTYTQAVMDEILRLSSVAPLGIFHRTISNTNVDNFFIPKNSLIFPNYFACHTDPRTWTKPLDFYPEHFLSSTERGELKYSPREDLVPFGIGKRQCIGESLARMEFFIFFVSIIQKYEVKFAESISDKLYEENLLGNDGIIRYSKIKNFIFKIRDEEICI